ncbi:MAG: gliding motility-associated ABC transporter substrate-binding protein GldG [Lewinellaceae bacterium]|nr:gliding motility-associated ABC transporter substrate-binding protein GldG [Saprospiraceae bacterium]MCB9339420.1 gliding motility-associated ABC transporter substrate-binding protein GldG [Lewinellaceae bacterium]
MSNKRKQSFLQLGLVLGIALFLNILGNAFFAHLDLTEEKRFTLTEPTQQLLDSLDDVVYVEVLLEGEFPAGFKRLQRSTREMLDDFRSQSGFIEYSFVDPNRGTVEEMNARREELAKDGIIPTVLRVKDAKGGTSEKVIYPYAKVNYKGRLAVVDLLDEQGPVRSPEEQERQLNGSISQMEYKFANALYKLDIGIREIVAFTVGHGELGEQDRADLIKSLRAYYDVGNFNLDSAAVIPKDVSVLIVAKPRFPFSDRDKFLIDQYVMNGGKVIWLIDRLNVEMDSLRATGSYVARDYPLELDDILFKYGARVNPDLVLDLNCTHIPMVIDQTGTMERFKWYYYPIVLPATNHVMVKSLDGVNLYFPSSIDTIKTKTQVKKTILLATSDKSRLQPNITRLNFEILRYGEDIVPTFNKQHIPVAVLLEGEFPSLFENRVTESFKATLDQIGQEFKTVSPPTRMLVVSDGDIARNGFDPQTGKAIPLGYNRIENYQFANKDFLLNAVEYLKDEKGIIEARGKEVKLRLLDTVRAEDQATMWQLLNIGLPLAFVALFGFVFNWVRKKRFAR